MAKHFEEIWNSAEAVSELLGTASAEAFKEIEVASKAFQDIDAIEGLSNKHETKTILLGEILYHLCVIAREHKLNSAAALTNAIEDARSAMEDPDEEG